MPMPMDPPSHKKKHGPPGQWTPPLLKEESWPGPLTRAGLGGGREWGLGLKFVSLLDFNFHFLLTFLLLRILASFATVWHQQLSCKGFLWNRMFRRGRRLNQAIGCNKSMGQRH